MVVYIDYMLAAYGRNLRNTPGVLARMEELAVTAVVDTEFLHNAPMIMREAGSQPERSASRGNVLRNQRVVARCLEASDALLLTPNHQINFSSSTS